MSGPGRTTLAMFMFVAIFGGANAVAVRFSNAELAPFWGAGLRFAVAAAILLVIALARGAPRPRGRAAVGVIAFGVVNFGLSYAFIYYALDYAPAATAQVVLALTPLTTLILAVAQGLESFRMRALVGGLVAVAGIGLVFADQTSLDVPPAALLALLATVACIAESGVIVKRFPPGDPWMANAVGMAIGAALLVALSLVAAEPRILPAQPETIAALAYLVVIGSVVVFVMVLKIIHEWTATAASYLFLLFPLVAGVLGSLLADEPVTPALIAGGLIVVAGVWIGALAPEKPTSDIVEITPGA